MKIVVIANFASQPLEEAFKFWSQQLDLPLPVSYAPFGQILEPLLSGFNGPEFEATLFSIMINPRLFVNDERMSPERSAVELVEAIVSCAHRRPASFFTCILCPSRDLHYDRRFWQSAESAIEGETRIQLMDSTTIARRYHVEEVSDCKFGDSDFPYTFEYYAALSTAIVRLYASLGNRRKAIITDCDYTLWDGACEEDGTSNVQIDLRYRLVQEFLVTCARRGFILAICSRNSKGTVLEVLNRADCVLKPQDFAHIECSWAEKTESLPRVFDALGLRPQDSILLDDDPLVCLSVGRQFEDLTVVQLPSEKPFDVLDANWAFDRWIVSAEDGIRNQTYKGRDAIRDSRGILDTAQLNELLATSIDLRAAVPADVARVCQLFDRATRWNTIGSLERSRVLSAINDHDCIVASLSDKFGGYGIVGAMVFSDRTVEGLAVSCRAIERGVETKLIGQAQDLTDGLLEVWVLTTDRNEPIQIFLKDLQRKGQIELVFSVVHTENGRRIPPEEESHG